MESRNSVPFTAVWPICPNFWPSPGQFWTNFVRTVDQDMLGLWGVLLVRNCNYVGEWGKHVYSQLSGSQPCKNTGSSVTTTLQRTRKTLLIPNQTPPAKIMTGTILIIINSCLKFGVGMANSWWAGRSGGTSIPLSSAVQIAQHQWAGSNMGGWVWSPNRIPERYGLERRWKIDMKMIILRLTLIYNRL